VHLSNIQKQINIAGGRPAASYFLLLRQKENNQRKGDPGLPPLRGSLDQPQASGAAQLDLARRTPRAPLRDSNSARLNLRLLAADRGGAQGMKSKRRGVRYAHDFLFCRQRSERYTGNDVGCVRANLLCACELTPRGGK
jgi:hypothetical protein